MLRRAFTGCVALIAVFGSSDAAIAEKIKIVFPTAPNTSNVPYFVAAEKGWFKDMGLEIEEIYVQGDATAFRTLLAGEGDLTTVGPSTTMLGYIKGAKVKAFAAWQPTVDYQFITTKAKAATFTKGLEGLTMAGAGGPSMLNHMVAMMMKKHGLDPSANKHIAIGGHGDRLAAVIAGKADMTLVNTITAARAGDQVNQVASVARELGGMGYHYLVAREETLANPERRAALTKLVRGSVMGARTTLADLAFATQATHKRMPEVSVELVRKVIGELSADNMWGIDGGIPDSVTEYTVKAYVEYQQIERAVTPQEILFKGIVDDVNAALKDWSPGKGS